MVQPLQTPARNVRPATEDDRPQLDALQTENWGEPIVAGGGRLHDLRTLPTLVAVDVNNQVVGALCYEIAGNSMEIVSIEATIPHTGVGTMLLDAAAAEAIGHNLRRLWLITTNDNLDALRFYQRRGLRILDVRVGGLAESRKVKPSIPMIGSYGIPIRDEIVLGRDLHVRVEL